MAKKSAEKKITEMTTEELLAVVNEQATLIEELNKALTETVKSGAKEKVIVNHNGTSYEVLSKSFSFEGKVLTAESLKKDKETVAKLVEMSSGHLKSVE